jgi:hypothetical protein
MKELKYSVLYTLVLQVLCWTIFLICYEFPYISKDNAELLASIVGIVLIVIISILYVLFNKKIIKKYELKSRRYNILLMIFWVLFTCIITFTINELIEKDILHACYNDPNNTWLKCFLNGIECLLFGLEFLIQTIVLLLIKIIKKILKKLIK